MFFVSEKKMRRREGKIVNPDWHVVDDKQP